MSHAERYWLMKSEPDAFSIDDLRARRHRTLERRAQLPGAQPHARACRSGDGVLFYHSSCAVPGIVGLGDGGQRGLSGPHPVRPQIRLLRSEGTREEPRWSLVDVAFERKLKRTDPAGRNQASTPTRWAKSFALIRSAASRLSVLPVTAAQWKLLLSLE